MPLDREDNSAMTRDEIAAVQERLAAHGFPAGPVDGLLGPRTSAAIIAFKRARGLVTRPWVGPVTWDLLMADSFSGSAVTQPPWVREGLRIRGWHERHQNAELREWLRRDGQTLGDPARLPWCGDFVETCIRLALPGEPLPLELRRNPYWALNWRSFGIPCEPCLGSIVSITRNGGGHVGFAVGQDASRIFVLGGNQSDAVSIVPIEKARFVPESWRWPATFAAKRQPLPSMTSAEASAVNFA